MRLAKISILIGMTIFSAYTALAGAMDELKAYPVPLKGMKQVVITLPTATDKDARDLKVELRVGTMMKTDGTNRVFLANTIKTQTVQGWGYPYYEVTDEPVAASTMMAPIPSRPEKNELVFGQPILINYNSKLPVVVYIPNSYEVQYRLWKAQSDFQVIKKVPK